MSQVNKIPNTDKSFEIIKDKDGKTTQKSLPTSFMARSEGDTVIIYQISDKCSELEEDYKTLQINGVTYNSSKEAVVALNEFINFKLPAGGGSAGDVPKSGFMIRWNVSMNATIHSGGIYNLTQHLAGVPVLAYGITNAEFERVNTGSNALLKFPANAKLTSYILDVRLSGTMSASSDRSFTVDIRRADNSFVKGDTFTKAGGNVLSNETNNILTYTNGVTDPYTVGGMKIEINNTSSSTITLTGIELIIDANIKN